MQESPDLNPDWLGKISSLSINSWGISLKITFSIFFHRLAAEIQVSFFHADGKEPLSSDCLKWAPVTH